MSLTQPARQSAKAAIGITDLPPSTDPRRTPVVIGATGGSGTRAIHSVLAALGLFMGERLNGAGDAMDFEPFLDQWINRLIARGNRLDYTMGDLSLFQRWQVRRAFNRALGQYQKEWPSPQPWGWKNPRSK